MGGFLLLFFSSLFLSTNIYELIISFGMDKEVQDHYMSIEGL